MVNQIWPSGATIVWHSTLHPGGIKFELRGKTYQNNSHVVLEDIGEGDHALLCVTNYNNCCQYPYNGRWGGRGNWFFPNGTRVPSSGIHWDFHRTRGHMVVRLQRRRGGEEGTYRCVVPDAMNVIQTIYIGVHNTIGKSLPKTSNTLVFSEDLMAYVICHLLYSSCQLFFHRLT